MICGTDFLPTRKDNRASYAEQERDLASSSEECDSKAIYIAALAMTNRTGILMMRYRGAFSSLALAPCSRNKKRQTNAENVGREIRQDLPMFF